MKLPLCLLEGDDVLVGDDIPAETVSQLLKFSLLMSISRCFVLIMLGRRVKFYLVFLLSLQGLNEL